MSLTVAELNTRLTADTRDLQTGLRRAQSDVSSFGAQGGAAMKGFGGAIAAVTASAAFQQLQQLLKDSIMAASDLAEAANATGVAFGQATPQVTAWANSLSAAFGATTTEALNAASQFQLVSQEAGFTGQQVTDLAERAFDLGSVFNQSAADVSAAIKSGLVGEFEPLRRFGVILNQDKLQAEALAQGLIKPKEEMSAGVKQAVIYSEIMKQTAFAQGDAENTAESAAGQMRQLRSQVDELKTSVGAALLPAFTNLAGFLNASVIPAFTKLLDIIGKNVVTALHLAQGPLKVLGGVLDAVGADGFAEDVRGVVGTMDDWRVAMHGLDESFFDLKDDLVETNAAGGALNSTAGSLSSGLDDVGVSAEDAAKAAADLKDSLFAVKDAGFALEDSVLAAADAQAELNELLATGGVDAHKVERATEDLARANESLVDANERVTDAQEDFNDALAKAHERHLKDVQRAEEDLVKARQKLADETQDVADAEAKLAKLKAQRQARDQAIKNAKAQLLAADTVTERIIAQRALDSALGLEIVTDEELAAAQANITKEQGEVKTATDGVTQASKDLTAVQATEVTQSDSVKAAAERLKGAQDAVALATQKAKEAQDALTLAQQPAPGFAKQVEEANRAVERANWDAEKATWALEKAQRGYNEALKNQPKSVSLTRNETLNRTTNEKLNIAVDMKMIGLPTSGSGTVVPLQMRPTLVMHDGGMVPGPRGADVPAMLQAGETVIPAGGGGGGSDQPLVVQLVADGKVIQEILLGHQRRSGALGFN